MWMYSRCRLPEFRWPKTTILGTFDFWGLLYRSPFTDEGQIWYAIADPSDYVANFVSIGLFCWPLAAKKPILPVFGLTAFSGVANWHQSEKVEHRCTTTNLPLPNGIKIVSVLQRLHGEIGRTTLTFKSVTDRQTDRQTDRPKLNVYGRPGGAWNPSPTKLGMVIEDLAHVLAPLKHLGSDA